MYRMSRMKRAVVICVLPMIMGLAARAGAAPITWGSATNYAGDTDIVNVGSTVYAYDFGGENGVSPVETTINGVDFKPFNIPDQNSTTIGGLTVSETSPTQPIDGTNGKTFSGLSTAYNTMLQSSVWDAIVENIDVHATGLTVGQAYEVQIWSNLFGTGDGTQVSDGISAGPNLDNGVGQYVTGMFTASATTQDVFLTGTGSISPFGTEPVLTGYQLRAVPEPGTLAIFALGAGATLLRRRRAR